MAGVFLTSLYTFRMLFLVFAGKSRGAAAANARELRPTIATDGRTWRRWATATAGIPSIVLAVALPRRRPPRLPALPRRLALLRQLPWQRAARSAEAGGAAGQELSSRWRPSSSPSSAYPSPG